MADILMSHSFYRHRDTKLIAKMNDNFAKVFGSRLEKVSERVADKGTTVEDNAAALEAEANDTTNDSSKEGNK